jgi:hypothetical protein
MRAALTLILTSLVGLCFGQSDTGYTSQFETCEQAIKKAHDDAQAGVLRSISHGLVMSENSFDFDRFYENYMIAKYSIEVFNAGCIIWEHEKCYSDEMDKIIVGKFGPDFFERTEKDARKEYKKFKTLGLEERKQYINSQFTYNATDSKANYSKGYQELYKELRKRIDFANLDFSPYKFDRIGISLVVGQTGEIEFCKVVSRDFPRTIGEQIEREILAIGNWIPATLYGHAVKSKSVLTFKLKE